MIVVGRVELIVATIVVVLLLNIFPIVLLIAGRGMVRALGRETLGRCRRRGRGNRRSRSLRGSDLGLEDRICSAATSGSARGSSRALFHERTERVSGRLVQRWRGREVAQHRGSEGGAGGAGGESGGRAVAYAECEDCVMGDDTSSYPPFRRSR